MYEIIKNVINDGKYNLSRMLNKIKVMWIEDSITDDQKEELIQLANEKANPDYSYEDTNKRVDTVFSELSKLKETITTLTATVTNIQKAVESGGTTVEPVEPTEKEIEEWVNPNGLAYNPYNKKGIQVKHNGYIWENMLPDETFNVWEPGATGVYDNIWKKVRKVEE